MTVSSGVGKSRPKEKVNHRSLLSSREIPFWESISLEDLIRAQGVKAADNLDEISALWPEGDDPDELLRYVNEERALRRGSRQQRSIERFLS